MLALLLCLFATPALAADTDGDGVNNREDLCEGEAEVVNGYADDDGCADELGILVVDVKDLEWRPVARALVKVGDREVPTDLHGVVVFTDLMPGDTYSIRAQAPGYQPQLVEHVVPPEGRMDQVVTLDWMPVPLEVKVSDRQSGAPLQAVVTLRGPGHVEPVETEQGQTLLQVRPGDWTMTVYRDHYHEAERSLSLAPNSLRQLVEVALDPAWVGIEERAIAFERGMTALDAQQKLALDGLVRVLFAFPDMVLDLVGADDPRRGELSALRAQRVKTWLTDAGVEEGRIETRAAGDSEPIYSSWSTKGAAANRRVEVVVVVPPSDGAEGPPLPGQSEPIPAPEPFELRFSAGSAATPGVTPSDDLLAALAEHPEWTLVVTGHRDPSDAPLGLVRADHVRDYLVEQGVPSGRLRATAAGSDGKVTPRPVPPGDIALVTEEIYFASGDNRPLDRSVLDRVAETLRTRPWMRVLIQGHSSPSEPGGMADELSGARAQAVARALESAGVSAERLRTVGHGPRFAGDAPLELQRRVRFVVLPAEDRAATSFRSLEVPFDRGAAVLRDELAKTADALLRNPRLDLEVVGVAWSDEQSEMPEVLAAARARAVVDQLVLAGVAPGRLSIGTEIRPPGDAPEPGMAVLRTRSAPATGL